MNGDERQVTLVWEYNSDLFEAATVERLVAQYVAPAAAMVSALSSRISQIPRMLPGERRQLVEAWNATAVPYPQDMCVHEFAEAQAARTPDAVAVVYEDQQLPYAELNARANQLGDCLRGQGVGPEARVALCLERRLGGASDAGWDGGWGGGPVPARPRPDGRRAAVSGAADEESVWAPSRCLQHPLRVLLAHHAEITEDENSVAIRALLDGWRPYAAELRFERIPGNHVTMPKAPGVESIAECIVAGRRAWS